MGLGGWEDRLLDAALFELSHQPDGLSLAPAQRSQPQNFILIGRDHDPITPTGAYERTDCILWLVHYRHVSLQGRAAAVRSQVLTSSYNTGARADREAGEICFM